MVKNKINGASLRNAPVDSPSIFIDPLFALLLQEKAVTTSSKRETTFTPTLREKIQHDLLEIWNNPSYVQELIGQ